MTGRYKRQMKGSVKGTFWCSSNRWGRRFVHAQRYLLVPLREKALCICSEAPSEKALYISSGDPLVPFRQTEDALYMLRGTL